MNDDETVITMIEELESTALEVLNLKRTSIPRRPIVIEFCGSPKAGKTSCISALSMFLRRNGFRVKMLVERASVCPISNKYDPLFNVWTVCSALAELSETISNSPKDYDVVILDRGIFDALCWFEWQAAHYYLDHDSLERIAGFLTLKRWRAAIDLVLVFHASSDKSIDREYAALLTRKRGSIMREPILESYLAAMEVAADKYGSIFRSVRKFDTSEMDQNKVSFNVTKLVLNMLQDTVSESVGHIPIRHFENIEFNGAKPFSPDALPGGDCMVFDARPRVEKDEEAVQPIPILVITDTSRQRVLTARKNKKAAKETSPEYSKTLLYFGGHTRAEDSFISGKRDVMSVCRSALTRELKEEIGVDFCPDHLEPVLLVWEKDNDRSKKHLAICFIWEIDLDSLQIKLDRNEFSVNADSGPAFAFVRDLKTAQLESWSQAILARIFNVMTAQQELKLE
ncbi:putative phosphoesterase (MutT family) [Hydrogenophaga sp. T4]|nr:putative phosphoesterase (MutT family) [Hydrogenophaga sp. T4]